MLCVDNKLHKFKKHLSILSEVSDVQTMEQANKKWCVVLEKHTTILLILCDISSNWMFSK